MSSDDIVEPGDATLQAILAGIAERTPEGEQRDKILDLILTLPPLKQWPTASLERLLDVAEFVVARCRQVE